MHTSIATVSLSGTLEEKLEAIANAGFDGVEIMDADIVSSPRPVSDIRRLVESLGLTIEIFQPFRDFEGVVPDLFAKNIRRAAAKLDVAAELGAPLMLLCSNVATATLDDDSLVSDQLHQLGELAADRGLKVAFEALAWGKFVSTYSHAWQLAADADHPAIGTCVDSFHIFAAGSDLSAMRSLPADRLMFCQVADARPLSLDALSWSRHHRLFPGQGGFDLAEFMSTLNSTGYDGPVSIEVFNDVFRQVDPQRTAVDALRSLRYLEQTVAGAATREGPARAPLAIDFIELRGDSGNTGAALEKFGFTNNGPHVSKDVWLWSQGEVSIIVNAHPVSATPTAETAFTGFGLQAKDAAAWVQRADRLLTPRVKRGQRAGEDVLYGMLAPDSSEMYFAEAPTPDKPGWRQEFPSTAVEPGIGVQRIDHVSLAQPWEHFDEAVLFFRALLDLEPADLLDVADQRGLVSSQAMESSDNEIRLVLTVNPPSLRGDRDRVPPHHIAFAVDDIFSSADRLRDNGAETLVIPSNYYDDLLVRFDLESADVDAMRSRNILYDRSETGEFWQFYTHPIGNVFLEFVKRGPIYEGYGAANAPVRRAAQQADVDVNMR